MSKENLSDFEKRMVLAYSDKVQKKNGSFKQSPETQREQWLKKNPNIIAVSQHCKSDREIPEENMEKMYKLIGRYLEELNQRRHPQMDAFFFYCLIFQTR